VGKKNLGGDPLRDVVLVQATQCGQEQALLRLGKEYKHNALGMAIKVNRRVRDDPEDWWNRFLVALGGYENPPGNLASFAGKCGLKNWLATVAGRFARKYPPPPPPQPIDVYQDDPPDLRNRTPKQEEEEEQAHERARKRALGVRKILDGLPTEDQVMIHLIYEHGLHQNAVAVRMGIKPWIITRKKKRWMKLFRRLL
jgi:DNA-directed RNA polymerase specialized sigma24 family protein